MLFEEEDAALLKKWIIKRLEDISDADSDVLADYVLALLRHDQTQEEVQKLCIEQLDDFLHDHTAQFVKDVFVTLGNQNFTGTNSALAGAPQPQQPQQHQQVQPQNPQSSISLGVSHPSLVPAGPVADVRGIKRERSHFERDREGSSGRDAYSPSMGSARGYKAPRRGGGSAPSGPGRWSGGNGNGGGGHVGGGAPGRGGISGGSVYSHPQGPVEIPFVPPGGPPPPPAIPQFGMPPIPPPGFPWAIAGPGDPMGAYLAAQAAAVAWGGFPPIGPPAVGKGEEKKAIEKVGERCKDYDEKGFCMKGDMCPYEHGMDRYVVPTEASAADEYDPNNSQLFSSDTSTQNNPSNNNSNSNINSNNNRGHGDNRGRGRGRGNRGGGGGGGGGNRGGRSEFSGTGPSYDRNNTTLVVEHIPDDKLEESAIRAFFSEFGTVLKVDITPDKQLATVKFERWDMARKAYDSPAPIFDNRFVKVFWYKPNAEQNGATAVAAAKHKEASPVADEMEIDMEEFKKKQEEAQKAHEAKMLKKKANEEAAKELERRKEELQRMQLEEKRKLEEKLAKKRARSAAASASPPASGASPAAGGSSKADAQAATTAALEAQLRALQAEAQSLGIEGSDAAPEYGSYRGRGRGRFPLRGRGGYVPRGGVYAPTYGSYRGRGALPTARGRGGALKLDNRTRKVTVSAADLRGGKDEEFRHYLMNTGLEVEGIEPHPDKDDTQIVTFKDRRTAEKFIYTGNDIPNVGEVTLAWFNAPPSNPSPNKSEDSSRMDIEENGTSSSSAAAASSSVIHHHHINSNDHGDDDVYEDDEGRWE